MMFMKDCISEWIILESLVLNLPLILILLVLYSMSGRLRQSIDVLGAVLMFVLIRSICGAVAGVLDGTEQKTTLINDLQLVEQSFWMQ